MKKLLKGAGPEAGVGLGGRVVVGSELVGVEVDLRIVGADVADGLAFGLVRDERTRVGTLPVGVEEEAATGEDSPPARLATHTLPAIRAIQKNILRMAAPNPIAIGNSLVCLIIEEEVPSTGGEDS